MYKYLILGLWAELLSALRATSNSTQRPQKIGNCTRMPYPLIWQNIHPCGLPNAYKLMCFYKNVNGNRDVKFLECNYLLVQRCVKLTLVREMGTVYPRIVPPLNSFPTFMYCEQRSQYIRPNSKMNSFHGNYSRKYGIYTVDIFTI